MELKDLIRRAREIREKYAELEVKTYGRAWTSEEIALGFVGDVGDLMKLIMALNDIRHIEDAQLKIGHELADCLWSVIVLSDIFDINLEKTFVSSMDELEKNIDAKVKQLS